MGLHVDIGRAAALVALGGDDLVVVLPEVHPMASPGVEVVLHVDRASDAIGGAHRPVLLEGPCAIDRGRVVASRDVDVVGTAVSVDTAPVLGSAAGVVCPIGLNDIVLDEGVACPAVDGKVAVAARVECAAIVDSPMVESQPSQRCIGSRRKHYRPVPGFQPLPPTKLPVFLQFTEYRLPSPMV